MDSTNISKKVKIKIRRTEERKYRKTERKEKRKKEKEICWHAKAEARA